MKKLFLILSSATLLTACNSLQWNSDILRGGGRGPASAQSSTQPTPSAPTVPGAPLSAMAPQDTLDTVATDQTATSQGGAIAAAGAVSGFTGRASTIATLGDPAIPGLWMETPLVSTEQRARLRSPKGNEVTVTLKPISGAASAGSRLSISAMRALGAPLTELVEVQVLPAS